jgi:hypothetical protein
MWNYTPSTLESSHGSHMPRTRAPEYEMDPCTQSSSPMALGTCRHVATPLGDG